MSPALRKRLRQIHLLLGLTVGLHFALMGLTGSLLVFVEPLDRWLHPELLTVDPAAEKSPAAFSTVLASFRESFPDAPINRISPPLEAGSVYEFRLDGWGGNMRQAYMDPYTAEVLGSRRLTDSFPGQLKYLHYNLMLGDFGWDLNGYFGLMSIVLLLTGLVLWWPMNRRQWADRLRIRRGTRPARKLWDLHAVIGAWSLPFLLVIAITGTTFGFKEKVAAFLDSIDPPAPSVPRQVDVPAGQGGMPIDNLITVARSVAPEAQLYRVHPSGQPGQPLRVYLQLPGGERWGGRVTVTMDPYRGDILHISDPRESSLSHRYARLRFPIHSGRYGGLPTRALQVILGLLPICFLVTGFLLWRGRNRKARPREGSRALNKHSDQFTVSAGSDADR